MQIYLQLLFLISRLSMNFHNNLMFYRERMLAPRLTPGWWTTHCLMSAATYSMYSQLPSIAGGRPSNHNLRTRLIVVTGDPPNMVQDRDKCRAVVNAIELLERKSSGSVLEIRQYCRRDPSRCPRGTLYPQKLLLISPTSDGHSIGIVHSRTQATELFCFIYLRVVFV
jgi:hypothetical protein